MISIARTRAKDQGLANVYFEQADVSAFAAEASAHDMVLAMSILHLLENRDAVIDAAFCCLKPGGTFISSTACLSGMYRLMQPILAGGRMLGLLPSVYFFSPDQLCECITRAGFQIESQWTPSNGRTLFLVARKPA